MSSSRQWRSRCAARRTKPSLPSNDCRANIRPPGSIAGPGNDWLDFAERRPRDDQSSAIREAGEVVVGLAGSADPVPPPRRDGMRGKARSREAGSRGLSNVPRRDAAGPAQRASPTWQRFLTHVYLITPALLPSERRTLTPKVEACRLRP